MAEVSQLVTPTKDGKSSRDRSPSFPFIPLQTAVERLAALEKYFGRHPAPVDKAGLAWDMKGKSSQADQTLAALRSFGLVAYEGSGANRKAVLSEDGRTYLRAQQDTIKQQVLKRAALRPKAIRTFWDIWAADRPPEPVCLDELVLKSGFSDTGAASFLKVYDATISYAGLSPSDKVETNGETAEKPDEQPSPVKVGDYVQWTSSGIDQFKHPRRVVGIFPDGKHVQVFGSNTGIPMSELTLAEPPVAAPSAAGTGAQERVEAGSAWAQGENDFNVLQRGNRLQITADVDLEGIATLKEMLGDYESILRRLDKQTKKDSV